MSITIDNFSYFQDDWTNVSSFFSIAECDDTDKQTFIQMQALGKEFQLYTKGW